MLILFDHGTPAPIRSYLQGHTIRRTQEMGWDRLTNSELLAAAEQAGFDLLLTTDKNNGPYCACTFSMWFRPSLRRRQAAIRKWIFQLN